MSNEKKGDEYIFPGIAMGRDDGPTSTGHIYLNTGE